MVKPQIYLMHKVKSLFSNSLRRYSTSTWWIVPPTVRYSLLLGLIALTTLGFRYEENALAGKLILKINNVSKDRGIIWIGLYDSADNYLIKEKSILKKIDVTQKGYHEMVIDSLPFGTYAIALFHDLNANGEMDRNFLGIPSEPYAFSKKPRSKWRLPKFDEVKFDFSKDKQEIATKLKKWYD